MHSPLICTYNSAGEGKRGGWWIKKGTSFFSYFKSPTIPSQLVATGAGSVKFVIDEVDTVAGCCYPDLDMIGGLLINITKND